MPTIRELMLCLDTKQVKAPLCSISLVSVALSFAMYVFGRLSYGVFASRRKKGGVSQTEGEERSGRARKGAVEGKDSKVIDAYEQVLFFFSPGGPILMMVLLPGIINC